MDVLNKKQRSYCMSQIRSRDTKPELFFRKLLSTGNIRGYRLKAKITGKPDIYFPVKRIAVFIDGCFWHRCPRCFIRPKTNRSFWTPKFRQNVARDRKVDTLLKRENIKVLRFWEHSVKEKPEICYNKFLKIYEKKIA